MTTWPTNRAYDAIFTSCGIVECNGSVAEAQGLCSWDKRWRCRDEDFVRHHPQECVLVEFVVENYSEWSLYVVFNFESVPGPILDQDHWIFLCQSLSSLRPSPLTRSLSSPVIGLARQPRPSVSCTPCAHRKYLEHRVRVVQGPLCQLPVVVALAKNLRRALRNTRSIVFHQRRIQSEPIELIDCPCSGGVLWIAVWRPGLATMDWLPLAGRETLRKWAQLLNFAASRLERASATSGAM